MAIAGGCSWSVATVDIAELKNRLSHDLRLVRAGEAVVVRNRDQAIARIEPVREPSSVDDEERRLARLEQSGVIRRGTGQIRQAPAVEVDVVAAGLQDREESW
jgi:antitoxin (DNA-binding transcriptional repressor) of toxin-antitoxin stability system